MVPLGLGRWLGCSNAMMCFWMRSILISLL